MLDFMIPLDEQHIGKFLKPGSTTIMGPASFQPRAGDTEQLRKGRASVNDIRFRKIIALGNPVLGGLHHEYRLQRIAA